MKERQNFLLILHFWNENVKRVLVNRTQKISADKVNKHFSANSKHEQIEFQDAWFKFQASAYLF